MATTTVTKRVVVAPVVDATKRVVVSPVVDVTKRVIGPVD